MKRNSTPRIDAAEKALAARIRLLEKAQGQVQRHKWQLDEQVKELHALKCAASAPTADEFRLVIVAQEPYFWNEVSMLDDVLGDHTPDVVCGATWQKHYASKAEWLDARAAVEAETQQWIDAYNGDGVYGWCAALEQRNRVTDEWEVIDSCGGFYSVTDSAPEDQIRDQLTSDHSEGCEIVYGRDGDK